MTALALSLEYLCIVDEHGMFPVPWASRLESAGGLGGTLDRFVLGNGRIGWNDVDCSASEADSALDQCEQSVILATANLVAGLEVRATLANDDGTSLRSLASVQLPPRNCGLESRPFLEEPCPFLCAMSHTLNVPVAVAPVTNRPS